MGPGHVPTDHLHLQQGQQVYADPSSYDHIFQRANQYNPGPSWDQFNPNPPNNVLPQSSANQTWQHGSLPQRYNSPAQPYGNANSPYPQTSAFPYTQYNGHPAQVNSYGPQAAVDPALAQEPLPTRAQQQSPYQPALRTVAPQGQPTVSPRALQQSAVPNLTARPASSPYQVSYRP